LAGRQDDQRRTKKQSNDTLGQKPSQLPARMDRNLIHSRLLSKLNASFRNLNTKTPVIGVNRNGRKIPGIRVRLESREQVFAKWDGPPRAGFAF
jgi:hypothetical protein